VLHHVIRRPLFSAAATLTVLAATGAVYSSSVADAAGPHVAEAAFHSASPSPEELASASAQAGADAADQAFASTARERAAQELREKRAAAAAAAAAEAKRVAEEERLAATEAARDAAREAASRNAQRDPRGLAKIMVADRGWSSEQFSCLDSLWTKESNWRWNADNPSSSAYGIPQALPGSKMSSAGSDWETNPATQIEWGLGYIEGRYGDPCSAWAHSQSNNWY
jgi:hypothetical protein